MRCKPGDIAVVVRCHFPENIGRVVHVLEPAVGFMRPDMPAWRVDDQGRPLTVYLRSGGGVGQSNGNAFCYDDRLRPMRDSDGEDEMLRIAGKPTETPADVIREVADATGN